MGEPLSNYRVRGRRQPPNDRDRVGAFRVASYVWGSKDFSGASAEELLAAIEAEAIQPKTVTKMVGRWWYRHEVEEEVPDIERRYLAFIKDWSVPTGNGWQVALAREQDIERYQIDKERPLSTVVSVADKYPSDVLIIPDEKKPDSHITLLSYYQERGALGLRGLSLSLHSQTYARMGNNRDGGYPILDVLSLGEEDLDHQLIAVVRFWNQQLGTSPRDLLFQLSPVSQSVSVTGVCLATT